MTETPTYEGPSLLASLIRFKWLVAALTLLFAVVAYTWSVRQPYEATARILLNLPSNYDIFGQPQQTVEPRRHLQNQALVAQSPPVLDLATTLADGLTSPEQLHDDMTVVPSDRSDDTISISVRYATPEGAARLANAVAQAYERYVAQETRSGADRIAVQMDTVAQGIRRKLASSQAALRLRPDDPVARADQDVAKALLNALSQRSQQVRIDADAYGGGVRLLEPALPEQARLQTIRFSASGALAGLVVSACLAWLLAGRPSPDSRRHVAEKVLRSPLLAEVPEFSPERERNALLPALAAPSPVADAYGLLLASVCPDFPNGRAILVTSALAGEGKTETCLNLAALANQSERRTLLVDTVRPRGRATRFAGTQALTSLADWASGRTASGEIALESGSQDHVGPEVVPIGPLRGAGSFLHSPAFPLALQRLRLYGDLVILDTPAMLSSSEALEIARHVDGVLVVVTPSTPLDALQEVRRRLDLVDARIIGYVLNRTNQRISPYAFRNGTPAHAPA